MAQLVDIPNVGRVEFPDGMSPDDISNAINNDILKNHTLKTPSPTEAKGSTIGNFMSGLGQGIKDTGQGLKQLGLGALGGLGVVSPDSQSNYTQQVDKERAAYDSSPLGQSTAGNIGRLIGNIAPAFAVPGGVAGSLATRMGTGALAGAGLGATQYVPEDGSRALNAGLGGLLGGAAPVATGLLAKGYNAVKGNVIDPAAQAVIDLGKKYGVRIGAADATNNSVLKSIDQGLEEIPVVGTRGFRAAQNEEAKNAAQGLLGNLENQMRNTEFNKPEIYSGWKNTRGSGLLFHGRSEPLGELRDHSAPKVDSLYDPSSVRSLLSKDWGGGLYTTDSIKNANIYATRNNFDDTPGYIYQLKEKTPVPLMPVDAMKISDIFDDLQPFAKKWGVNVDEMNTLRNFADVNEINLGRTGVELVRALQKQIQNGIFPKDKADPYIKILNMLDDYQKNSGYRGIRTSNNNLGYNVNNYFNPKKDLDVKLLNSEDLKNFMNKKTLETIAESNSSRAQKAKELLGDIANSGDDWQKNTETSAKLKLLNNQLIAEQKYGTVEELADIYGSVPTTNTLKALDNAITSESSSFAPDRNVLNFAKNMRENIANGQYSYSQLRKDQSRLGAMIADANQGKNSLIGTQGAGVIQNIRNAVRKDMDTFAQNQGPGLTKAWREADNFYKNNVVPFKDAQLAKALSNNAPDEIYSKFITSGGTEGEKGTTRASKLYNALDSKGQAAVRYGMAKNAFDKAYNPDTGAFSPAKFASEFDKIAAAKGVFFQGPAKAEIDGFKNLMRHVERSNVAINKPETGVRAIPYLVGGALAGGAYIDPSSTLGVLTSAYGLKKLMTTPAGRNFLLSSSKFKAGSPQMQKALDKFISAAQLGVAQGTVSNINRGD